jgi:YbbR domain-containing protein
MNWIDEHLKTLKEYARDYVLENTGLKVLALLITGVLWLSVASRPVSQVALSGSIEFNLPATPPLTVSRYDTLTARVFLEGPRDTLDALRAGQLTVTADMSAVEPGVRVIPLRIDPNRLPASVRVKEIEPPTITVTVEREVPITPRWEGDPPPGYQVIDWQIVPETVKIGGAESQMRELTQVSTESVRLSDRTGPFSQQVAIDIGSPNLSLSEASSRKVMLTVNIGEAMKERVIDKVPVALFGAPARAHAIPRFVTVTVYGAGTLVDELTVSDVSVGIEYEAGSRTFSPRITLAPEYAEHVTVRSVEPKTVRVR